MYETFSLDKLITDHFEKSFQKIIIYGHNFRLMRFFRELEDLFEIVLKPKDVQEIVIIDVRQLPDFKSKSKEVERILKRYGFRYKIV